MIAPAAVPIRTGGLMVLAKPGWTGSAWASCRVAGAEGNPARFRWIAMAAAQRCTVPVNPYQDQVAAYTLSADRLSAAALPVSDSADAIATRIAALDTSSED